MSGEIGAAAERLNERKRALLGELLEIGEGQGLAMEADAAILLSGFDLDREEVMRFGESCQQMLIACNAGRAGQPRRAGPVG